MHRVTNSIIAQLAGIIVTRHLAGSSSLKVPAANLDFTTFPSHNYISPANYTAAVPGTTFAAQDITGASFTITVPVGMSLRIHFGAAYGGLSTAAPERHLQLRVASTLLKDALALAGAPLSGVYNVAGSGISTTYKLSASCGTTSGSFDYRDMYMNWEIYTPT